MTYAYPMMTQRTLIQGHLILQSIFEAWLSNPRCSYTFHRLNKMQPPLSLFVFGVTEQHCEQ